MSGADRGGPRWFGSRARPLYGWLHAAEGRARDLGVVLCPAFGREELSSHRSLRQLARQLAAAGIATLRFDYPCTGDSAGGTDEEPPAPELVRDWIASVGLAIDALRRDSGVTRVALVGLRLGALLAAHGGAGRADVAGLVALAPEGAGRAFVREARMLGGARAGAEGEPLESGGFVLAPRTCADLAALAPSPPGQAPAPRVLIVDRDDLPPSARLAQAWRAGGAQVDSRAAGGYAQLMLDPEHAKVPAEMLSCAAQWLRALAGDDAPPDAWPAPRVAAWAALPAGDGGTAAAAGSPEASGLAVAAGFQERIVTVETASLAMAGVLSVPADGRCLGALVLPNAGATRRIGPGRLNVELARHLAARGWWVLRVDLGGLGDTPPAAGAADHLVYARGGVAELAAAARWLRAETRAPRVEAVGLCSGAYHAYKVAAGSGGLDGFVAVNPLAFVWNYDQPAGVPLDKAIGEMKRYRGVLLRRDYWLKLLRGEVDLRHLSSVLRARASIATGRIRQPLARLFGRGAPGDVGAALRTMTDAGVAARFVFAAGDPGETLLAEVGGSTLRRLVRDGDVALERIDGADHTFTWQAERRELFARLTRLLATAGTPATRAPTASPRT